jgi:coenzyme Q-binding protein COQ10
MARCSKRRVLPYTPDELFEMVGDVRRYPDFVPWINAMRVSNERADGEGVTLLDAEAAVGFSFLRERFATRVRRDRTARRIDVQLLSGPFRKLRGVWNFRPHPTGTELEFDIEFEFKSRLLDRMLAVNLDPAVAQLISCFEGRARALYTPVRGELKGPRSAEPPADPAAGPVRA